jgi:hypothetical protein
MRFEAPLDALRRQAVEDRPAFMQALKASGMSKVGERLAFEQQLLAGNARPSAAADGLPQSFIASAFPTKREYEESLLLPPAERVYAENAARRKVNAGVPVGAIERPPKFHGLIQSASPAAACDDRTRTDTALSTFAFHTLRSSGDADRTS